MLAGLVAFVFAPRSEPDFGLPAADERLKAPVTIAAKLEPLDAFLLTLGRERGLDLRVERKMAELKTTAFAEDMPLRTALGHVADAFDAEWVPIEGGYRLAMSVPARNRLENHRAAEVRSARETTERRLRVLARIAEASWSELTRPAERAEAEAEANPDDPELRATAAESRGATPSKDTYAFACLLRSLDAEGWRALWAGDVLMASTEARGIPSLPRELGRTPSRTDAKGRRTVLPLAQVRIAVRRDPASGEWEGRMTEMYPPTAPPTGDPEAFDYASQHINLPPSDPAAPSSGGDDAFTKALAAWRRTRGAPLSAPFDRPWKVGAAVTSPWPRQAWTSTETLESIHRATSLPVFAEVDRRIVPNPFEGADPSLASLFERIGGPIRLTQGALLGRPANYWRTRETEPPEPVLRAYEAASDFDGCARALTRWEGSAADAGFPRDIAVKRPFPFPYDAFRLWGRLSDAQRRRLRGGNAVRLDEISTGGQTAALRVVARTMLDSAPLSRWSLSVLDAPLQPETLKEASIYFSDARPDEVRLSIGPSPERAITLRIARGIFSKG